MAANDHKLVEHKQCDREHCPICDGGLALCRICNGAEGSLPSDCPGRPMTDAEETQVYENDLDFVVFKGEPTGTWVRHSLPKPLNKVDRETLHKAVKRKRGVMQ